jgi:hypothetical protein
VGLDLRRLQVDGGRASPGNDAMTEPESDEELEARLAQSLLDILVNGTWTSSVCSGYCGNPDCDHGRGRLHP